MKKFLILFFLSTLSMQAQSTLELFKQSLPREVIADEQLKNMAVANLDRAMSIHPNIIYSYLYFLEAQVTDANKENVKSRMVHYNDLLKYYNKRKYDWAEKNFNNFKSSSEEEQLKTGFLQYFSNIMFSVKKDFKDNYSEIAIDSNKINFIAVVYYKKDKNLKYEPESDYLGERIDIENEIILKLKNSKSMDLSDLLREIDTYWFLYEKLSYAEQKNILLGLVKSENTVEDKRNRFGISASFLYNGLFQYNKELSATNGWTKYINYKDIYKAVGFSAGYLWRLKEVKTFLSYLKVDAGIAIGIGDNYESTTSMPYARKITTTSSEVIDESFVISNGKITFSNNQSLYLRVSIPLLYIGSRLSLEGSFVAYGNNCKYTSTGEYSFVRDTKTYYYTGYFWTYDVKRTVGSGSLDEQETITSFKFFPTLNLNYEISNNFTLGLNFFPGYYNAQLQFLF